MKNVAFCVNIEIFQANKINTHNTNVIGKCGVDISIMLMERKGANGKEIGLHCIKVNINNAISKIWNYSEWQTLPLGVLYAATLFPMLK